LVAFDALMDERSVTRAASRVGLSQPVREALTLIRGALAARPAFDPARDRAACTVSCSDYSLLMLIGPLVRQLAAAALGGGHPRAAADTGSRPAAA
jgi:LysR family nod box-dependent transcriptional activator